MIAIKLKLYLAIKSFLEMIWTLEADRFLASNSARPFLPTNAKSLSEPVSKIREDVG